MEAREPLRAEKAGRRSGTDYRGIFDAFDDAILIHDVDTGDIVDVNRGMCEMFGYTREEAVRLNIGDLCGGDSVQSVETLRGLIEKTAGGESLTLQWRPVTSSGRRFWTEVSLKRIDVEGRERVLAVVRDISQPKQAEEALQESEARFRLVTEGSLAGVYIIQDRNFAYVNPTMAQIFGYEVEEILGGGVKPASLVHPEDLPLVRENLRKRLEGVERSVQYTFRGLRHDGAVIYCEVLGASIEYQGRPAVMGTLVDITERLRAEEALKASEARYRAIVEDQAELVTRYKPDFTVSFWNEACCRYFQTSPETVLGHSFLPFIPEADRARVVASIADLTRENPIAVIEHRVMKSDGAIAWQQWNNRAIFDDQGKVVEYQAVGRDITDRRQAEEALRTQTDLLNTVFSATPDMLVLKDHNFVYQTVNPALCRFLSKPAEEIVGKTDFDLFPREEAEKSRRDDEGVMAEGVPRIRDKELTGPLGKKWFQVIKTPVMDSKGLPIGILCSVTDISRRKQAEEGLRESEERYRSLFQNNHAAMLLIDPETAAIVDANPAACSFYGYRKEELMVKKITDLNVLESDRVFGEMSRAKSRQKNHFFFQHRLADGRLRHVEVFSGPIRVHGRELLYSIIHDVTGRKKAEDALRETSNALQTLILASPLPIAALDHDHNIMMWNPAAERIFGWSAAEVLGRRIPIIPEDQWAETAARIQRELHGEAQSGLELRRLKKDGSLIDVQLWTSPLRNARGEIIGTLGIFADIRERKQAEEAVRASEAKYRTLVEQIPAVTYVSALDNVTSHIYISPQIETVLEFSQDEWLANRESFKNQIHPEDRDRVLSELILSYSQGGPFASEYRLRSKSGGVVWVRDESRAVYDAEGLPLFMQGVALDITARKEAEQALREANSRLKALVQASPLAIIALDTEARVRSWNPAAERIFGWSSSEIIGRPLPYIQKEEKKKFRQLYRRTLQGETIQGLELRRQRRDGSLVEVSLSTAPLYDAAGNIAGIMGVLEDITRRKKIEETLKMELEERRKTEEALRESEARFRAVFEGAGMGIALVDLQGKLMKINPALREMLGFTDEEMRRKGIGEISHPDDWPPDAALYTELVAGKRSHYQLEKRYFHKNGNRVWGRLNVSLVRGAAGEPQFAIGMVEDITERKRAEEELRGQAELLDLAHDAILVCDPHNRTIFWNRGAAETYGWEQAEVLGKVTHELLKTEFPRPLAEIETELLQQGQWQGELIHTRRNGQRIVVTSRWVQRCDPQGRPSAILEINRDITERVRAEKAADEVRRQQAAILSNIPDLAWLKDSESRFIAVNEPFGRACGVAPENLAGKTDLDIWPLELAQKYRDDDREVMRTGQSKRVEEPLADQEGHLGWIETVKTPIFNEKGEVIGTTGIARDITRRRQMEEALKKVSRALKAITECHQAMMRASSEEELLLEVCRIIEEVGGYLMAWVGYAEPDRDQTVRPVAKKGFDAEYVQTIKVTWSETETGRGPVGTAIRKGTPAICRDTRVDPAFAPWREQALERGYASLLALPLKHHQTFGALAIYAAEPNAFDDEEIDLLMGLANDLAYGITALRAETERQRAEEALRESQDKLRLLTSQLLTIQERERRRVSRELHDELGQALTVLKIHLVAIETKLRKDQQSLKGDCEQLLSYIDGVIENVRRLSWDLSPSILEDLGLSSSLGYLIDEICRSNNLSCSLALGEIDQLFSPETRIHIYRIFQESLTNIVRHAQASHISVAMQQEGDSVTFILKDNGTGFDQEKVMAREAAKRGLGLTAMNERALMAGGSLSIWSRKGQGTHIAFRIPMDR